MKILTLLFVMIPHFCFAMTTIKLGEGKTDFHATGNPGFLKIHGKGKAPTGNVAVDQGKLNGTILVDLTSLDTGMSLRNKHMKEKYLQVDQFPNAELSLKDAPLPKEWSMASPKLDSVKIPGTLKIHGHEKPVEVLAKVDPKGLLTAEFEVKISDFQIDIPSFMGVTVADKVKVEVESKLESLNAIQGT